MGEWLDVVNVEEFALGERCLIDVDGITVAIFNLGGEYFAIQDICPHDGGELADGKLEGDEIICPRHGARFSIKTGEVLGPPAYENIQTYAVRVSNGRVQVKAG